MRIAGLALTLLTAGPAAAQQPAAAQPLDSTQRASAVLAIGPSPEASRLLQSLAAAQVLPATQSSLTDRLHLVPPLQRSRGSHALIGGLIGSAAGIVVCTAISNLVNEGGFSTCTTSGYVGFAVGGFAVGALVGYLIK
jgi:hypothetical protein